MQGATGTSGAPANPRRSGARYFEPLGEAARTGMFDILAHPDLVKVWGRERPLPDGDLRRFYDRAMDGIADSDVAVEVSTAGLRKPAGEIYPAPALPRDVPRGRAAGGAVQRRPPARAPRPRVRACAELLDASAFASWPSSTAASAGWRRSGEPADRIGYDTHRFADGRRLVLGGVEIEGAERGLEGHSDADALTHAVSTRCSERRASATSAQHFPDDDERWRDADSIELLREVGRFLDEHGWRRERRRDGDLRGAEAGAHRDAMRARARRAARRSHRGDVNVKFTTNETMGSIGRGEGIAAIAVATLDRGVYACPPSTHRARETVQCRLVGQATAAIMQSDPADEPAALRTRTAAEVAARERLDLPGGAAALAPVVAPAPPS